MMKRTRKHSHLRYTAAPHADIPVLQQEHYEVLGYDFYDAKYMIRPKPLICDLETGLGLCYETTALTISTQQFL